MGLGHTDYWANVQTHYWFGARTGQPDTEYVDLFIGMNSKRIIYRVIFSRCTLARIFKVNGGVPLSPFAGAYSSLSFRPCEFPRLLKSRTVDFPAVRASTDGDYSARRNGGSEEREAIMLPGCDFNQWLIVWEFPKDPVATRKRMIHTYLNTLAAVLASMEEVKKNMDAFSTTLHRISMLCICRNIREIPGSA